MLAELQALAGPSYYNRIDIRFPREGYDEVKRDTLARLAEQAPATLAGQEVVERKELDTNDGFKFYRTDGSWLLIRFSGTEALLRVYAEARSPEDVDALLAEGRRIARGRPLMDARDYFGYKNPDEEPGGPDPAEDEDDEGTRPPLFEEAVTLDDPATRKRIDPDDMLGRVADLPRQLAAGASRRGAGDAERAPHRRRRRRRARHGRLRHRRRAGGRRGGRPARRCR